MQIATIGLTVDAIKVVMPPLAAAAATIKSSRDPDIKTSLLSDCPAAAEDEEEEAEEAEEEEEEEEEEDPNLIIKIEEILDSNVEREMKLANKDSLSAASLISDASLSRFFKASCRVFASSSAARNLSGNEAPFRAKMMDLLTMLASSEVLNKTAYPLPINLPATTDISRTFPSVLTRIAADRITPFAAVLPPPLEE